MSTFSPRLDAATMVEQQIGKLVDARIVHGERSAGFEGQQSRRSTNIAASLQRRRARQIRMGERGQP